MAVPPFMVDTSGAAKGYSRRLESVGFDATSAFSINYLMQGSFVDDDQDFNKFEYAVIIKKWTPETIELEVDFSEPALVSLSPTPDMLQITISNPYLFVSEDGKLIDTSKFVIMQELPR